MNFVETSLFFPFSHVPFLMKFKFASIICVLIIQLYKYKFNKILIILIINYVRDNNDGFTRYRFEI